MAPDLSTLLAEAIARAWPPDPSSVPVEWHRVESSLLPALRRLESASPTEALGSRADVLATLAPHPPLAERVRTEFEKLRLRAEREQPELAIDVSGQAKHYRHAMVEVAYATDRQRTGKATVANWFSGERGELSIGVARVSVPDDHRMGRLDNPRAWSLWFRRDHRQRLDLAHATVSPAADPVSSIAALVRRAPSPELLMFLHGYNVSFADAMRRAAQIAYDLDFTGVPLLFSWPSKATTASYFSDGESALWSQQNFAAFLRLAVTGLGAERVHLLAHSMGNRILTDTLADLQTNPLPAGSARLGQVVFAAPDVDAGVFVQRAKAFAGRAEHFTLYVSDRDRALAMSQRFARYRRAGQAGAGIVVVDGVDTIDVSELDTGLMSHSYVATHRSVVSDLYYLIRRGHPPNERFGLHPVVARTGIHWAFRRQ